MTQKTFVNWEHGLFLQPQHFQCMENNFIYQQSLLHKYTLPYSWGVADIEVDQSSLESDVFNLSKLTCVFSEGFVINVDVNALFVARSFKEAWKQREQGLTVYIGVKNLFDGQPNVTMINSEDELKNVSTRFASYREGRTVSDLYHAGTDANISSIYFVARVFWGHEVEEVHHYTMIPVAQLVKSDEKVVLSTKYVAPCIQLVGSHNLLSHLQRLREKTASVASDLEDYKIPIEWYSSEQTNNLGYLLALRSLSRYAPAIYQFLRNPYNHPFHLYIFLMEMVGELTFYVREYTMFGQTQEGDKLVADYDHKNLSEVFPPLFQFLDYLLEKISANPERVVRMHATDGIYVAELPERFFASNAGYYLIVAPQDGDHQKIAEELEQSAKLTAASEIDKFIEHALHGVPIKRLASTPEGVPKGPKCIYFQIDPKSNHWQKIADERKAAFYPGSVDTELNVDIVRGFAYE